MLTNLPPITPTSLLSWLLQSSVVLGAGWLFYYLALRRERCFHYNRRFLLLAPWLALALPPLLTITVPWLQEVVQPLAGVAGQGLLFEDLLPEIRITANGTGAIAAPDVLRWLPLVYGVVVLALLARLGAQVLQLWLTTRRWPRESRSGYTLVLTGGKRPVSSFGRWVFWDETSSLTSSEAQVVLAHEVAHVLQCHTRDRLLLEAARAVLWACPFVHCFPRALELTHEFLADAAALQPTATTPAAPAESYAAVLARLALRQLHPDLPLTHSFTNSLTLTRIRMLTSQSPLRPWKKWLLLPLSTALLFTMACEKTTSPAELTAKATQNAEPTPPPPPPPVEVSDSPAPPPPPPAYFYVEEMPEYAGGMKQLLQDIAKQVVYPASALAEKLEGRVFVKFIVAADGSMQAIQLQKGINYKVTYPGEAGEQKATTIITPAAQALNEAALNAIRQLPGKWKPGRQDGQPVAVFYTVPITFSLK